MRKCLFRHGLPRMHALEALRHNRSANNDDCFGAGEVAVL